MHDQMLVRVVHGREHLEEQPQAREHIELGARRSNQRERHAIDVLEHDEGLTRRQHARVVQARHVGVAERRQRIALARESRQVALALQDEHGHLERHLALHHAVGALRQPHHRHAAAPELANQPVSGQHLAGGQCGWRLRAFIRAMPVDDGSREHA